MILIGPFDCNRSINKLCNYNRLNVLYLFGIVVCCDVLCLFSGCHMGMPKLPSEGYNKLDKFLRQYRAKELVTLIIIIIIVITSES